MQSKPLRILLGTILTIVGLGTVMWNFYPHSAEGFGLLIGGGVLLVSGVVLLGSREVGQFIIRIIKP